MFNSTHPSGQLARWCLALQEVDLHTHYRPGKKNANADALSRCPISLKSSQASQSSVLSIVSAISVSQFPAKDRETDLCTQHYEDPELLEVITFLVEDTLPKDKKKARELALTHRMRWWMVSSTILRLCVILPEQDNKTCFTKPIVFT